MHKSYFTPRVTRTDTSVASDGVELTLFELDSAVQGTVYDLFTCDFVMTDGEETAYYYIVLSLKNPSDVTIEGEMIDEKGNIITIIPEYKNTARIAQHNVNGNIQNVSGDVSLRVRAKYASEKGAMQAPELTIPITPILPKGSHTLVHPTKRKSGEPVRRYGNRNPSYTISCGSAEPNYVVTVLDCDSNNDANIDYICKWGNASSSYKPYFGIPGEGSVKGPKGGTLDLSKYPPTATCTATPRDKNIGGAMLLAGANSIEWLGDIDPADIANGASYETKPGDITFSQGISNNILKYQFVGAWNNGLVPLDNPEQNRVKYFDYTLRMTVQFIIPNKVQKYGVIVTSIKQTSQTALVDDSVLPIKVMFDCFAAGTKILTPNGEVLVEEIKPGDTVSTTDGESIVENVQMSKVSPYLTITTAESGTLSLTSDHPVLAENGLTAAGSLKTGDVIITQGGKAVVEAIREETGAVYSLNVRGMLFANGFIIGGGA